MDRLSNLPEPIRSHITSFLPMVDAIRTSVLSTHWRHVTASLPILEFDQDEFVKRRNFEGNDFRNIVNLLLVNRNKGPALSRFKLIANVDDEPETVRHINAWITFAINNNVQDLFLGFLSGTLKKLPCCFFDYTRLTVLRLVSIHLKLPAVTRFPLLKRMTLKYVTFYDEKLTENLFSSCAVLEDLTIAQCSFLNPNAVLTISVTNLKVLMVYLCSNSIWISTPNLQKIDCFCHKLPNFNWATLASLLLAKFNPCGDRNNTCVALILMQLRNVVRLNLSGFYIESMARNLDLFAQFPNVRVNLKHLELEMLPAGQHVNVLIFLLGFYNNIASLRISFQRDPTSTNVPNVQGCTKQPDLSKWCMLKNLKAVGIKNFGGSEIELRILKYFLENASSLNRMKIKYLDDKKNNANIRMKVSEELLAFTKASSQALIFFK